MADDNENPQPDDSQANETTQDERPLADPDLSDRHRRDQDPSQIMKR